MEEEEKDKGEKRVSRKKERNKRGMGRRTWKSR